MDFIAPNPVDELRPIAVLRKGQRLKSRYCKVRHRGQASSLGPIALAAKHCITFHRTQFSRAPSDCVFTAVLYVSDSDKVYRYTDEGTLPLPAKRRDRKRD